MKRAVLQFLNFKTLAAFFAAMLLLGGCAKDLGVSKKEEVQIPKWYINAPSNNQIYLYGTGEGSNLEEAKTMALNNMSSRLVVSVGSTLKKKTTTTTSSNGVSTYSKDISQDVKIDVEKIRFTNAKVEKSSVLGNSFFVLMKVNRNDLLNEKQKEFAVLDKRLSDKFAQLDSKPILEKIYHLKQMYPDTIKAKKLSFVLYAISNEFNYAPYFAKYDSYIDKINYLKDKLTIKVSTNDKYKFFADELIELLNINDYKITKDQANVEIKINNKIRYSTARGWKIAKVSTTMSIVSNEKIIANKTINTIGRSSSSNENALASAAMYFKKELQKRGLDEILFNK